MSGAGNRHHFFLFVCHQRSVLFLGRVHTDRNPNRRSIGSVTMGLQMILAKLLSRLLLIVSVGSLKGVRKDRSTIACKHTESPRLGIAVAGGPVRGLQHKRDQFWVYFIRLKARQPQASTVGNAPQQASKVFD